MPLEPNKQLKATVYGIIVIIYDAAAVADRRVFYDKQGSRNDGNLRSNFQW